MLIAQVASTDPASSVARVDSAMADRPKSTESNYLVTVCVENELFAMKHFVNNWLTNQFNFRTKAIHCDHKIHKKCKHVFGLNVVLNKLSYFRTS